MNIIESPQQNNADKKHQLRPPIKPMNQPIANRVKRVLNILFAVCMA